MQDQQDPIRILRRSALWTAAVVFLALSVPAWSQVHVLEVLADKDSRFKIAGQNRPEITVKAGEAVLLRIEARRGKSWDRDGAVHGFTLLHAKDRAKVPGWNLELKRGKQEFQLVAPSQPGEYEVVCTVICSDDHEGMRIKFLVVP